MAAQSNMRDRTDWMNDVTSNDLPGPGKLEAIVQLALDEAARLGVDQAEVAASHDTGLSATAWVGEVERL